MHRDNNSRLAHSVPGPHETPYGARCAQGRSAAVALREVLARSACGMILPFDEVSSWLTFHSRERMIAEEDRGVSLEAGGTRPL